MTSIQFRLIGGQIRKCPSNEPKRTLRQAWVVPCCHGSFDEVVHLPVVARPAKCLKAVGARC